VRKSVFEKSYSNEPTEDYSESEGCGASERE